MWSGSAYGYDCSAARMPRVWRSVGKVGMIGQPGRVVRTFPLYVKAMFTELSKEAVVFLDAVTWVLECNPGWEWCVCNYGWSSSGRASGAWDT